MTIKAQLSDARTALILAYDLDAGAYADVWADSDPPPELDAQIEGVKQTMHKAAALLRQYATAMEN
jgi:hypothetical protein